MNLLSRLGLDRRAIFGLSGVLVFLVWWYFSLPNELFFGDDGRLIYTAQHGGFLSHFPDSLFQAELLKYRPIASGTLSLLAPLLGANHAAWEAVAKFVNLFASVVLFLCCWFVSKRNLYVSLFLTLLFGISRFEYHGLTQAWGIFEGVPLVFTLLLLLEAVLYFGEEQSGSLTRAVLWYGLMIYSYERFLPMILPLLLFLLLAKRARNLILLTIGIFASNALIKAIFFHFNFLQGTGGQAIHFQPSTLAFFIGTGLANLLGFPLTPQYLSGMQFDQLSMWHHLASVTFALAVLATFILALRIKRPAWPEVPAQWATPAVLCTAFAALLLVASVTFRQEYRFLYSPYAVLLIGVAFALGQIATFRSLVFALATVAGFAGFAVDAPYHDYVVNTWFGSTAQWLAEAKELLIDQRVQHHNHVVVITHGVETAQSFVLNPWFFGTYDPQADFDIAFVVEPPADMQLDTSYYDLGLLHFTEATSDVRIHMLTTTARPRIDLAKLPCSQSSIGPDTSAAARVIYEGWPSLYDSVPSITVPVGSACTFSHIRATQGDKLTFFAAVPARSAEWEGTHIVDAALLSVCVHDGKRVICVLERKTVLQPTAHNIRWSYFAANLSAFAGRDISITVSAILPAGDLYPGAVAIGLPWIQRR